MAISNTIKNKLNKMNRAAQDARLGDRLQVGGVVAGSAAVTTAQMSASAVILYDALANLGGFVYSVAKSTGSPMLLTGFKHARSGGSLTIMPVNSGSFTVGDVVTYIIW